MLIHTTLRLYLILLLLVGSIGISIGQALVLNKGESGFSPLYNFSKSYNNRVRSNGSVRQVGISASISRQTEISLTRITATGSRQESRGLGFGFGAIINGKRNLHGRVGVGLALVDGDASFAPEITLFSNSSTTTSKLVPSLTLLYTDRELAYGGGLNFRVGDTVNLIGGVSLLRLPEGSLLSITFGMMISGGEKTIASASTEASE